MNGLGATHSPRSKGAPGSAVLSPSEARLLERLLRAPGRIVLYNDIDRLLGGKSSDGVSRRVLISRLRAKLAATRLCNVETVRLVGLRAELAEPVAETLPRLRAAYGLAAE